MQDESTAMESLLRVHYETFHKSLRLSKSWKLPRFFECYGHVVNRCIKEGVKEQLFLLRYINSFRNVIHNYEILEEKSNHDENENERMAKKQFLSTPVYYGCNISSFSVIDQFLFDETMKSNQRFEEILREQPLLNAFSGLFKLVHEFIGENYCLTTGKMKRPSCNSQIIDLLNNMIKMFAFNVKFNDCLRDVNGNVLVNQKFKLLSSDINLIITESEDLSPLSEDDWMNGLAASQILQRINKFGYDTYSILLIFHSNSISYFITRKNSFTHLPDHFEVEFISRFNVDSMNEFLDFFSEIWMYLLRIIERSPHVPNPFDGMLSREEFSILAVYLINFPCVLANRKANEERNKERNRYWNKIQDGYTKKENQKSKIRKKMKKEKCISSTVIERFKKLELF